MNARAAQWTLERVGLVLTAIAGAIGVVVFAASIGAKIAAADFVTVVRHEKDLEDFRDECVERLAAAGVLQMQRESAIIQRLDTFREEQKASEERVTKQLNSILNILLQRGR